MPVIQGQKMACEPCIRGHRSTKCTHANERIMIPVKKPGRPLSSCPHLNGKLCGCGSVTAAMPRRGKCNCRNPAQNSSGAPAKVKTEPLNPDNPPLSPTRATTFRVQKTAAKPPSRKQSFDPAPLELVNPSTFNHPNHPAIPFSMDGGVGRSDSMAPESFATSLALGFDDITDFTSQFGGYQLAGRLGTAMDSFVPSNGLADLSPTISSTNGASGHSGFASGTSSAAQHTPTSSSGSFSLEMPSEELGSCYPQEPQPESQPTSQAQSQSQVPAQFQPLAQPQNALDLLGYGPSVPSGSNGVAGQFPHPQTLGFNSHVYSPDYQPTIYTYPPPFGTPVHPVQLSNWQQADMAGNSQSASQSSYMNGPCQLDPNASSAKAFSSHPCICGSECQCVGCLTHPFNSATQDYVRSAIDSQFGATAATEDYVQSFSGTRNSISATIPNATLPAAVNGRSTVLEKTSETAAGPGPEDQDYPSHDYLFVRFNGERIGLSCEGQSNSCPCGDDCACIGCIIHGKAYEAMDQTS